MLDGLACFRHRSAQRRVKAYNKHSRGVASVLFTMPGQQNLQRGSARMRDRSKYGGDGTMRFIANPGHVPTPRQWATEPADAVSFECLVVAAGCQCGGGYSGGHYVGIPDSAVRNWWGGVVWTAPRRDASFVRGTRAEHTQAVAVRAMLRPVDVDLLGVRDAIRVQMKEMGIVSNMSRN